MSKTSDNSTVFSGTASFDAITASTITATHVTAATVTTSNFGPPILFGNITLSGNLIPVADGALNLGNSSTSFSHNYTLTSHIATIDKIPSNSRINLNATIFPIPDNTLDFGSPSFRFANIHGVNSNTTNATIDSVSSSGSQITLGSHLIPSTDNTLDIGNVSKRYRSSWVFGSVVDAIQAVSSQISLASNLIPLADNTYDIGSSSLRLRKEYSLTNFMKKEFAGSTFGYTTGGFDLTVAGSDTKLPITINEGNFSDLVFTNTFRFPQMGWYMVTFNITFDLSVVTNSLVLNIKNTTISEIQQQHTLDAKVDSQKTVCFGIWVAGSTDNFIITGKATAATIANVRVPFGRLALCSSFP
jgi:hypothetical protein